MNYERERLHRQGLAEGRDPDTGLAVYVPPDRPVEPENIELLEREEGLHGGPVAHSTGPWWQAPEGEWPPPW